MNSLVPLGEHSISWNMRNTGESIQRNIKIIYFIKACKCHRSKKNTFETQSCREVKTNQAALKRGSTIQKTNN